jgi:hypothetical protein
VKADILRTQIEAPDVYATIRDYTFEWSRKSDACVMIIQYWVDRPRRPRRVQVLAVNAVTMQPMERHRSVYLIPAQDEQQIEDAADALFQKYSR